MYKKKGFTLAEVVVTLGVLGAIAVVAMPLFGRIVPNEEMLMIKKVFYLTGRTVNELINDDDFYPDKDSEKTSGFANTDGKMYHGQNHVGNSKFCTLFASRMNLSTDVNCSSAIVSFGNPGVPPQQYHFKTIDGVAWIIQLGDFGATDVSEHPTTEQWITVDVNGDKGGNCYPQQANCAKPDRFYLFIDRFGQIRTHDSRDFFNDCGVVQAYLDSSDTTKSYKDIQGIYHLSCGAKN